MSAAFDAHPLFFSSSVFLRPWCSHWGFVGILNLVGYLKRLVEFCSMLTVLIFYITEVQSQSIEMS